MSKKTLIDSVRVASPCTEDWEQMQGNEQARFCTHCSKNVRDLSAITRKRAMRLVQDSGSNICIRYIPDPSTGQPLFSEQLVRLTRHRPRLLAGVMSASLSLSTFAHAQESPVPATPESEQQIVADQTPVTGSNDQEEVEGSETPKQDPDKSIIEGFVVDETGKVVQDVHLMITNTEDDENDYETTDERGYFKFVDIEPGNYLIRVYGINGLRKAMPPVTVNAGQTLNQYLHVTREKDTDSEETTYFGSGMGGAMAVIPYKLPLTQAVAEGCRFLTFSVFLSRDM